MMASPGTLTLSGAYPTTGALQNWDGMQEEISQTLVTFFAVRPAEEGIAAGRQVSRTRATRKPRCTLTRCGPRQEEKERMRQERKEAIELATFDALDADARLTTLQTFDSEHDEKALASINSVARSRRAAPLHNEVRRRRPSPAVSCDANTDPCFRACTGIPACWQLSG